MGLFLRTRRPKPGFTNPLLATTDFTIVVCSDLHMAVGPFSSLETAVRIAKTLSAKSDCRFFPVPINPGMKMLKEPSEETVEESVEELSPGGYL